MARRQAPTARAPTPAVTWRDGVHVSGTSIWCDARRARDVCFVSSADQLTRASHGQLVATRETLALLGDAAGAHLAVPYGRPFTLGTVRLELVPTGHALGAAALWIEHAGLRVLYAGAIAGGPHVGLGAPAELRSCDALVVAAPYGGREHRFPPAHTAAAALADWAAAAVGARRAPAVLVTSVGKGLDVAVYLASAGLGVVGHRAIVDAAERLRAAGLAPAARTRDDELTLRRPGRTAANDRVTVWLARDRNRLPAAAGDRPIALASGLATEPAALHELGAAAGFAWSNAADRDGLIALCRASGARQVFVTGRCAVAIARALGGGAVVLGPPRQMGLFEERSA